MHRLNSRFNISPNLKEFIKYDYNTLIELQSSVALTSDAYASSRHSWFPVSKDITRLSSHVADSSDIVVRILFVGSPVCAK